MAMDSAVQLFHTAKVTRELIDWQKKRSLSSFTFRKSGSQVRSVFVGTTLLIECQSQHSHVCFASFLGNFGGGKHDNHPPASVSKNSSGRALLVGYDAVEAESIECLWEKYFADPSQWWDNTIAKRNHRAPDFKHKVTGEALWIFNPSTPQWVKARSFELTGAGRKRFGPSGIRSHRDPSQVNRLPKNNGKGYHQPTSTAEWRRVVPVAVDKHFQKASVAREWVAILKNNLQQGLIIDANMYLDVLQRCFKQKDLVSAKQVHDCIKNSEMEQNPYVANYLLKVYIRCGRLKDSRQVFDKLVEKSVLNWTTMIGGYAEHNYAKDALEVYYQMRQAGEQPTEITYLSILKACATPGGLKWGKGIHAHIRHDGFQSDLRVETALVTMYAKGGSLDDARLVFDNMVERNIITWNAMIGGLAQHGCGQEAFSLFLQMQREGFVPNGTTYLSILSASASPRALEWVKEVYTHAIKSGLASDLRVGNALIFMCAKSGSIDDAHLVFDRMVKRNVSSWNAMIGGLAQHGWAQKAFLLFLQMQKEGCVPNIFTYVSLLSASASASADVEWVKEVHSHAVKAGIAFDLRVGSALIHSYAKSGSIDDARLVFNTMNERNVISWTGMIGGLAQHGRGHEALQLFEEMKADGIKPNGYSFLSVLSACSHAGLVDEGRRQFLSMTQDYGIEPTMKHYTCMIDLLGRAGHLDDAKHFVLNMPVEPGLAPWGALLSACRSYGNLEMGVLAAKECLKLDPKDAKTYVLLSNIYAAAGMWDRRALVRSMMEGRGIHKDAGRSWIVIDNKVHCFIAGDTSHPETKEIYAALNRLSKILKAEGYVPDTRLVLRNFDEDARELALCYHSEKLAIAYGLMRSPLGKPIRVYKNLRVCSDCHTATKFISKVAGREIVAKDSYRFHHFKDGVCSCGDYW